MPKTYCARSGPGNVVVANSVADALAILAAQSFSFALLDVSLGLENSLPVARYVKTNSVPFAFGTGYGEDLTMGDALANVPFITKPYHRVSMLKALNRLLVPNATVPGTGHLAV
jgi:ActR/RegA family two-component response regulator